MLVRRAERSASALVSLVVETGAVAVAWNDAYDAVMCPIDQARRGGSPPFARRHLVDKGGKKMRTKIHPLQLRFRTPTVYFSK